MALSREVNPLCRPTIEAAPSVVHPMMLANGISLETKYTDYALKMASDVALTPKKSEKDIRRTANSWWG